MRVKMFWKAFPTGSSHKGVVGVKEHIKKALAPGTGENAAELEAEVNAWLSEHPGIRIAHIKQSASGDAALWWITVWYEGDE